MIKKLEMLDTLVNINEGTSLKDKTYRWAIGPYNHVFVYLGRWDLQRNSKTDPPKKNIKIGNFSFQPDVHFKERIYSAPLVTESVNRGRLPRLLSQRYGEKVKVMRLLPEFSEEKLMVRAMIMKAWELSGDLNAWYGYDDIISNVVPRMLNRKFGFKIPLRWIPDNSPICSGHTFDIFSVTNKRVLDIPRNMIPMPEDWVLKNLIQYEAGEIVLGPEYV